MKELEELKKLLAMAGDAQKFEEMMAAKDKLIAELEAEVAKLKA